MYGGLFSVCRVTEVRVPLPALHFFVPYNCYYKPCLPIFQLFFGHSPFSFVCFTGYSYFYAICSKKVSFRFSHLVAPILTDINIKRVETLNRDIRVRFLLFFCFVCTLYREQLLYSNTYFTRVQTFFFVLTRPASKQAMLAEPGLPLWQQRQRYLRLCSPLKDR